MLFYTLLNMKKCLFHKIIFSSRISLGKYCQKNIVRSGELGKKDMKG